MHKRIAIDQNENEYWKCNKENWQCENFDIKDNNDQQSYFPDHKSCLLRCNKLGSIPNALLTQIYPYLNSQSISRLHQSNSRFDPNKYKDNAMIKHLYSEKLLNLSNSTIKYNDPSITYDYFIYKLNLIKQTLSEIEMLEEKKEKKKSIVSTNVYLIVLENLSNIIKSLIS